MLRRLLRLFDPRIGIAILVVVVTILVFQFVVGGISSKRVSDSAGDLRAASAAVKTLEESVTVLKESGATNADQLKGRLGQIADVLPKKLNDVYVTTVFVAIAEAAGIEITKFEPTPRENSGTDATTVKILDIPGLEGSEYSFVVTGTVAGVTLFMEQIFTTNKVFATLNKATLSISGDSSQANVQGTVVIWTDATIDTVSPEDAAADSATTTIPSAVSTSPQAATPTTLPGSQDATPTTLPPASVPAPTNP